MSQMSLVRRALVALGSLTMLYAVVIVLSGTSFHPVGQLEFLIAVLIGHDGIVAPLAIVAGLVLTRWVPPRIRPIVQAGLFASLVVTLVALPFALARGKTADNPSALPLNYTIGWLWLLGVIWLVLVAVIAWRLRPAARSAHRGNMTRT
jgi:hypothetical protein